MHWGLRIAASVIWVIATGITLVLLYEFTAGAGAVYFAMMCFAVALASFSLVFARAGQKNGNWLTVVFSSGAWAVAVTALAVMELGYWDSKQEFTSSAHKTESLASSGRQELAHNAQVSLENYKSARPSAEVLAERDAILHKLVDRIGNTLAKATKYCADPSDFPRDCGKYTELGVELERSREKEKLEKRVWESATGPQVAVRTFDISAPAHIVSRWTGIDDAVTKDLLKGLFVFLLFIGRDGMLFVASAPNKTFLKVAVPAIKVARLEPDVAQLMQPDPVAQISAPVTQEAPQEEQHSKPHEVPHECRQEEHQEEQEKPVDRRKLKRQQKRLGKNVLPFDAARSKAKKLHTLEDVVRAYFDGMDGEFAFREVYPGMKALANKHKIGIREPLAGSAIQNVFGKESRIKRGRIVHYRIDGGGLAQSDIA